MSRRIVIGQPAVLPDVASPQVASVPAIEESADGRAPMGPVGKVLAELYSATESLHEQLSQPKPALHHEPFDVYIRQLTSRMARLKDAVIVAKSIVRHADRYRHVGSGDLARQGYTDLTYAIDHAQAKRREAVDTKNNLEQAFAEACRFNRWRRRAIDSRSSDGDAVRRLFMEVARERLDAAVFDGMLDAALRRLYGNSRGNG